MSKKEQEVETTGLENVNESLNNVVVKVQNNKKVVAICSVIVVVVVALVLVYVNLFRTPGIKKANDAIGAADLQLALGNDSVALAQYTNLADNGSYDAANRAALQSAIMLYKDGKYEEALKYVSKYSPSEEIIGAGALSLKGDCLVNLDRLDEAVKVYKSAISRSDKNPAYTPFFIMKLARVYAAQGKHAEEAAQYQAIINDYPLYGEQHNIDVQKLAERANLQAAQ